MPRRWVPVPRDRDQALVKYDGLLLGIARQSAPQLINFGSKYPYIPGATWNGRDLDRRFLSELEWPVWESVVSSLQAALTDAVIDDAVHALPPQHYAIKGADLTAALRARRDHLLDAAKRYYRQLGRQVDVYATDSDDQARLTRKAGGNVEVTLSRDAASDPYFHREFDPGVTREIRLFLDDGNDTAVVTGERRGGPLLRIIGGSGQDVLVDSARSGGDRSMTTRPDRRGLQAPGKGLIDGRTSCPERIPRIPRPAIGAAAGPPALRCTTGPRSDCSSVADGRSPPTAFANTLLDSAPVPGGYCIRAQDLSGGLSGRVPPGKFSQLRRGIARRVGYGRAQL